MRERAAVDRQHQDHPGGVCEVRRQPRCRAHAHGDRAVRQERRLHRGPARVHGEAQAAVYREMRIRNIKVRPVAAPMKRPLTTSTGALTASALLLIDLETDQGIVGRSYLFGIGKHNLPPMAKLVEAMTEMVKGDEVAPLELERKLRARYSLLGVHNMVIFA